MGNLQSGAGKPPPNCCAGVKALASEVTTAADRRSVLVDFSQRNETDKKSEMGFMNVREGGSGCPVWSRESCRVCNTICCRFNGRQKVLQPSAWGNSSCFTYAFSKVCDAVEVAENEVLTISSVVTTGLVNHRYGG